jgi:hypothetical protein
VLMRLHLNPGQRVIHIDAGAARLAAPALERGCQRVQSDAGLYSAKIWPPSTSSVSPML